jgi:hypothetical protein
MLICIFWNYIVYAVLNYAIIKSKLFENVRVGVLAPAIVCKMKVHWDNILITYQIKKLELFY